MSDFIADLTRALEDQAKMLRRLRARSLGECSEEEAWRCIQRSMRDNYHDSIHTPMESYWRAALEIADRALQSASGFAEAGAVRRWDDG